MAKTFVISDTHFNHAGILEFKDYIGKPVRNFDSIEQMNECMLDRWADTVGPKDTVIHCGDVLFGMDKADWMAKHFDKLPGKKRLVVGNHDNLKILAPFFKDMQLWIDMSDKGLLFSHTPQHASTLAESHRFGTGPILNIHGHIHTNPSPEGPYKCVCVEQTDFAPVDSETLHAE